MIACNTKMGFPKKSLRGYMHNFTMDGTPPPPTPRPPPPLAHIKSKEQESVTLSVAEAGHFVGARNPHRPARHAVLGGPKGTHFDPPPLVSGAADGSAAHIPPLEHNVMYVHFGRFRSNGSLRRWRRCRRQRRSFLISCWRGFHK